MKKLGFGVVLLALVGAVLWWTYQRTPGMLATDSAAPLAYVPADTPYVFANIDPIPRPVIDKAFKQTADMVDLYAELMQTAREDLAKSDRESDKRIAALLDALSKEFKGKTPEEINRSIGFGLDGRVALYGIGLVPVLRAEVAEPDNLRGFIARMEAAAGEPMPTATIDGKPYWRLSDSDGMAPLMAVIALLDRHLVITLAPSAADDALLRTLLGLQRPDRSLLASGALDEFNREHGFTPYFSGYVDSARVLAELSGPSSAVQQAFLTALELEKPSVDAVCAEEYRALAAAWPRLSLGYDRLEPDYNESRLILETRPDIAAELMKLRAPMPGLGPHAEQSLMNFGLSFKLSALPAVVGGFAGQVEKAPWQCPSLTALNASFAQAKQSLNNPALFAAAPVFSGVHAIIDSVELNLQDPTAEPSGTGVLLIGSDNPQSLIGMAKGMLPPLASLDLPTDGSVVALPVLPGAPAQLQAFAAAREHVIGIGVGAAVKDQLPGLLNADPQQQPLFVMGVSARFYTLLADAMEQATAQDSEESEQAKAMLRQQAEMLRTLYPKLFQRMEARLELSERGIELRQVVLTPSL